MCWWMKGDRSGSAYLHFVAGFGCRRGRMTSVPHSHLPYGEPGCGTFGQWLGQQYYAYIASVLDQILDAVDSVSLTSDPKGTVFTIGDYGTADGATSLPLMWKIINLVRSKWREIPIQIIYEDQPSNDFNSLFKRVHGLIPDPQSYLNHFHNVFVMASGTSFYHPVMPSNTAHLIISSIACHWLSEKPTNFKDSLNQLACSSEEEHKLVTAQAAKDWETFLLLRAEELQLGGMLIISQPAQTPEPEKKGAYEVAQNTMTKIWRQMADEGKISTEEFTNTNLNCCIRDLAEVRAPFEDSSSPVYKAGMRLVSDHLVKTPCLALQQWQGKLDTAGVDDRASFARTVVNQCRCCTNSSFLLGLDSSRIQREKDSLVDEMYSRVEEEMACMDPSQINTSLTVSYVFVRKV